LVNPLIGQLLSDFLVVGHIGSGGVGQVYLAHQQPIQLKAALKIIDPEETEIPASKLERFQLEASALARLTHPNIVRLLKYGRHDDRPYLVMEYVEGGRTLADALGRPMDPAAARHLLGQVANALGAAHTVDVVHRDIKPSNIMLQTVQGESDFVRVVDFGLAKFVDESQSTRFISGTPSYMAPEQVSQGHIGPWTDWYAVGALACEMIFGYQPYAHCGAQQMLALKITQGHDPLAAYSGIDYPVEWGQFARRAMAFDPADRFQDVREFQVALGTALDAFGSEALEIDGGGQLGHEDTLLSMDEVSPRQADAVNTTHPDPMASTAPDQDPALNTAPRRDGGSMVKILAVAILVGLGIFFLVHRQDDAPKTDTRSDSRKSTASTTLEGGPGTVKASSPTKAGSSPPVDAGGRPTVLKVDAAVRRAAPPKDASVAKTAPPPAAPVKAGTPRPPLKPKRKSRSRRPIRSRTTPKVPVTPKPEVGET